MNHEAIACQSLENAVEHLILEPREYEYLLQLQRDILAKLIVTDNTQEVLDKLCQLAEAMLSNAVASIMLLNPNTGLMSVRSAPSIPVLGHQALANLTPSPTGGSCGNAVFRNEAQYVIDTKTDPRWQDLRHIAFDFNLCSCWSMPIRNTQGEAIGSFALSSFEHRAPSSFHRQLLEICAFIVNIVLQRDHHEQQLSEHQQQLTKLAYYDQLTGLPNRQKLRVDIADNPPFACAILNIDAFKELNDLFGVTAGDRILQEVGHWLQQRYPSTYRMNGDEFAILIDAIIDDVTLYDLLSTLEQQLAKESFVINNEVISVQMTMGAAIGTERTLNRADIALHKAKETKKSIALYEESDDMEGKYRSNIAMATAIRKAIADNRIIAHYQPIVNIESGKTDKYETLMRMIDEDGQLVSPLDVIPIAKKTKLYSQLTRIIVTQACQLFAKRTEAFSVNLSIDDIQDTQTLDHIIQTIVMTETAPKITFELLESEGIDNYEAATNFISTVKALGAKIAIDDFGTGYSNFEHVLRLNVDYVKIDGSLIRGIADDGRYRMIVESIVNFANRINAQTIAEFVSDEGIFNSVNDLGVTYSQGYFTGKPNALSATY